MHAPRSPWGSALGWPLTVVQADSRFCQHGERAQTLGDGSSRLHYWWESARANALWAARHGYLHTLYCLDESCEHEVAGNLYAAWCKLRALQDVLSNRVTNSNRDAPQGALLSIGMVLFLDSDAFWHRPDMPIERLLGQYVPAGDWAARGADASSIFFGCNLPWKGEDRGKRRWNATLTNAERGPPNTGVMLLRNTASAREALRAWWSVPATTPQWNRNFAWEQSALWELWARQPGFARRMRVLHDERRNECMRTMDPQHPSPIVHVAGGRVEPGRREGRLDALGLRRNVSAAWFTCLTHLPPSGGAQPGCPSRRLDVSADGTVHLGACESCTT